MGFKQRFYIIYFRSMFINIFKNLSKNEKKRLKLTCTVYPIVLLNQNKD